MARGLPEVRLKFLSALSLEPMSGSDTVFGHTVSDLQTNVAVMGQYVTGKLKYVSEGSLPTTWGAGNFFAFDLSGNDFDGFTSVKVGLDPSPGSGLVEIIDDPDKNGTCKVTDKNTQKFVIEATTDGGFTHRREYDLSGLVVESE